MEEEEIPHPPLAAYWCRQCSKRNCNELNSLSRRPQVQKNRSQKQPSLLLVKRQLQLPTTTPIQPLTISRKNPAVYGILKHLPDDLRNDRTMVLMAVKQNWREIQHAETRLCRDKEIALTAVMQNWRAYYYYISSQTTSDENLATNADPHYPLLHTDREIAIAAVAQYWRTLPHITDDDRDDLDVALAAMSQYWRAIATSKKALDGEIETDKYNTEIAQTWFSLQHVAGLSMSDDVKTLLRQIWDLQKQELQSLHHAVNILRTEKDVVRAAVQQDPRVLQCVPTELRDDKAIALEAVQRDGRLLKFVSHGLRADKDIVLAAVRNAPDAIKYALGGLNQDRDCWIAANLWSTDYSTKKESDHRISVALSTRFSLNEKSESVVTRFTAMLNDTPYFRDGNFTIYSPNAFRKQSCDPEWTSLTWPCRGTFFTCRKVPFAKIGRPTNDSCWRYSYRYHLEEAKRTNGFMLQVVDYDWASDKHMLGRGQQIEMVMAQEVGTKVFRICQPVDNGVGCEFESCHMVELHSSVSEWYAKDSKDYTGCEIQFHRSKYHQGSNEPDLDENNDRDVDGEDTQQMNHSCWRTYIRILPDAEMEVKHPWECLVKDPWDMDPWDIVDYDPQKLPKWKVYGRKSGTRSLTDDDRLRGESILH